MFHVSGHGFGHASRQIEIINALARRRPDVRLVVRTSAARWLFDRTAAPVEFHHAECDTGIVQIDSLRLDAEDTIRRAAAFYETLDARADREARALEAAGARLVVGDVPPLAFAAAARGGVPAVAVSNFTWDWIYGGYEERRSAPGLVDAIGAAYATAAAGWRLPMHGGFETFRTIVDVPFVARRSTKTREAVRQALGLPLDRPLVLVSFGGYGLDRMDPAVLTGLDPYAIIVTRPASGEPEALTEGSLLRLPEQAIYGSGCRYEDLVAAVDVVVTKPGYGIVAECTANGTGILYTSRGRFREYDVIVDAMPRYVRCEFIDQQALLGGRWRPFLDRLLARPQPRERPRVDGADVVADMLLGTAFGTR